MGDIEDGHRAVMSLVTDHVSALERLAIQHVRQAREAGFLAGHDVGHAKGFEAGYRAALAELRRLSEAERLHVADGGAP